MTEGLRAPALHPGVRRTDTVATAGRSGHLTTNRRHTLVAFTLAFLLYLPGFWWGAPHATSSERVTPWGVDDATALEGLGKVQRAVSGRPDIHPGYPLLHPLIVSAAQAPYIGYMIVRGQLDPGPLEYPHGLRDPARALKVLTWIGHFVSVLMGAGVVATAYDAGRVLWNRRTGTLAALLVGLSYPMFYYARTGNVDMQVLLFTALALNAFARCLAFGSTRGRMVWLGVWAGLAVATKEPAFASFIGIPVALIIAERGRTPGLRPKFWRSAGLAVVAAFLAYGAGSGLFLAPDWWLAHIRFAQSRIDALAAGEIAFLPGYPFTMQGHLALAGETVRLLAAAMTWPGLLLAVVGSLWTVRRHPQHALFLLPAITYLAVLFWSARVVQLRYMLPVMLTLSFFAANAVSLASARTGRTLRIALATATALVMILSVQRGAALTYDMINDSRHAAGRWLAGRATAGDRVEFFGARQKLPPLADGVESARAYLYRGAAEHVDLGPAAERAVEQGWAERRPDFVIVIPDHSSRPHQPHSGAMPPAIYPRLLDGSLGYRLAAEFGTAPVPLWRRRPPLDYPTVNPPIRVFIRGAASP